MNSEDLSELSEDFYDKSAKHAAEIKEEIHVSKGIRKKLLKKELEQVLYLVQEVYFLRRLKMTESLFEGKHELIEEEKRAFDDIGERISELREELIEPVIRSEIDLEPPEERSNLVIEILSDFPEPIVASDFRFYGPFQEGEILNLPRRSAELLIDQGLARGIRGPRSEN